MWTEKKLAGHRMPQAKSIIVHEVQPGEANRCADSLLQNSKKEEC
jgi:hypothetical protein